MPPAGRGGPRARVAAVALVADSKESTPSLGVRLLADLRTVFGEADALSTEAILSALHALDEAPWAELVGGKPPNARGLGQRLRSYGVRSKSVRIGGATPKGYARADLADAWMRYLPARSRIRHVRNGATGDADGVARTAAPEQAELVADVPRGHPADAHNGHGGNGYGCLDCGTAAGGGRLLLHATRRRGRRHLGEATMPIEVRCRRCGRPFVADRAAILAGRWRLCPACRDPSPSGAPRGRPRPAAGAGGGGAVSGAPGRDPMDCLPGRRGAPSALELAKTLYKTPALVRHRVRCGKPACRCATGEGHGPYWFLHWRDGGVQRRRYVRQADVSAVRAVVEQRRQDDARAAGGGAGDGQSAEAASMAAELEAGW